MCICAFDCVINIELLICKYNVTPKRLHNVHNMNEEMDKLLKKYDNRHQMSAS